jgi:hypothetical protein
MVFTDKAESQIVHGFQNSVCMNKRLDWKELNERIKILSNYGNKKTATETIK